MLIQRHSAGLRLIPQHEHGLLSGELAAAWVGPGGEEALGEEVVLATALHDLAWRELDRAPRRDADTGLPLDFLRFPARPKYEAAARALDRIEELHPYAAVLVSLHYTSFGSPERPSAFEEAEEERRLALLDALDDEAPGPRRIRRDLDFLRLFDNLSLFLCLTPPGVSPEFRPGWLKPGLLRPPGTEEAVELTWEDEGTARVEPYPFEPDRLELSVECRELPGGGFPSDEALEEAWGAAGPSTWTVRVTGG